MHIKEIIRSIQNDMNKYRESKNLSNFEPAAVKFEGPIQNGNKKFWRISIVDEYDKVIKKYSTENYKKAVSLFSKISEDRMIDALDVTDTKPYLSLNITQ